MRKKNFKRAKRIVPDAIAGRMQKEEKVIKAPEKTQRPVPVPQEEKKEKKYLKPEPLPVEEIEPLGLQHQGMIELAENLQRDAAEFLEKQKPVAQSMGKPQALNYRSTKFEIINGKWIIKKEKQDTNTYEIALKVDAVIELQIHFGQGPTSIRLYNAVTKQSSFQLSYDKNERRQFDADVRFLKELIYK